MLLHLCVILFTGRGVSFPACITGQMTRVMSASMGSASRGSASRGSASRGVSAFRGVSACEGGSLHPMEVG